jgi:hypothetical protein
MIRSARHLNRFEEQRLLLPISREQVTDGAVGGAERRVSELIGWLVRATDGDLGHVDDFLFDEANGVVRYLVVDTSNWWFGKHVLVAPRWIRRMAWDERTISATIRRHRIKTAPEFAGAEHVDREWEAAYHRHLQLPGYWLDEHYAGSITPAQSYLREDTDRHAEFAERRSRLR